MTSGYYRFPTVNRDTIVFVSEDDLWSVPTRGGIARRLTSNLGEVTRPVLSQDGKWLAFVGREEGQADVYLMPALGGQAKRLTFHGGICWTVGWTKDDKIIFANHNGQPHNAILQLYRLDPETGSQELINIGPARNISFGPKSGMVIGRNTGDPARWKRYRGGTAGQIWVDAAGRGIFKPLIQLKGNLANPMWVGDRIYFLSDHEGIGNLYSCHPNGKGLRRHTHHEDYYARNASTDGKTIVYHAGADLYTFNISRNKTTLVKVEYHSPRVQRNRKFVNPSRYLQDAELHPKGQSLALTSRGKLYTFANWEGAVTQHGEGDGVRYRLPIWLNDGERLAAITDREGEEEFVIFHSDSSKEPEILKGLDIGRPISVSVNPNKDTIAFSNHRYELMILDLASRSLKTVDQGASERIGGFAWSPDGEWLAYSLSISLHVSIIKLWKASTDETFQVTDSVLSDVGPHFDPDGKYLYFLSWRHFNPVYDNMQFDLNFPRGMKPFLITLQKDLPSPFIPQPRKETKVEEKSSEEPKNEAAKDKEKESEESTEIKKADEKPVEKKPEEKPIQIDLEGITRRIVEFPADEGRYGRIIGLKGGKVLYSDYPVEGALGGGLQNGEPYSKGTLLVYNFEEQKEETLVNGIHDFDVSRDSSMLLYQTGYRLRVLKAGDRPENGNNASNRKGGWINLDRVKVSVNPGSEWNQMLTEAWRLMRDQFWTADMSKVDWLAVLKRYQPLVERVGTRAEFSDLAWEMQGELGTSHCYEFGGDYRSAPNYHNGYLGATFAYDAGTDSWRVESIAYGDAWNEEMTSPLARPGVNINVGDRITAINGRRLNKSLFPAQALVNLPGTEVLLTVTGANGAVRFVTVRTLPNETPVYYRQWIEKNRKQVHEATNGRVGYVYIPDMSAWGYAEFHRAYLAEVDREGLIVDLRYNGGGHVSPLLLQKLLRRRIGYDITRWGKHPYPYPPESVLGPVVALTNEFAGSDGDIFSHGFKMMGIGPLIGMRTWGGVVGIWPRHALVDGSRTSQPEFSFWFADVGWGVENYGTDPDIEVDNKPQDYAKGRDAQLERSIAEITKLMEKNPPQLPKFDRRPNLKLPKLRKKK
jgi:tricorn protease